MNFRRSDGNVLIEFIFIAVLIMVPLSLMAPSVYYLSNNFLAMSNAVRSGTRMLAISADFQSGKQKTSLIIRKELLQAGLDPNLFQIQVTCSEQACLSPGGFVTVKLSGASSLHNPLLDSISVPISVSQTIEVSGLQ